MHCLVIESKFAVTTNLNDQNNVWCIIRFNKYL